MYSLIMFAVTSVVFSIGFALSPIPWIVFGMIDRLIQRYG